MASLWQDSDLDSGSESDTEVSVPPGVDPMYASCVHTLKWKLYQTIVLGPEPNTPEAQQNELLQRYITQLERLYRILEKSLRGSVTDAEVRPFPVSLRHEILTCAMKFKGKNKGVSHVADVVPYQDFLKETLRMYPFVHRTVGSAVSSAVGGTIGSSDVEAL